MATTIASITTEDAGGGVLAVTITLSNGLLETFFVTTGDDGSQTWTKDDGTVVAVVPAGSGLSDELVQILIGQIHSDTRRTLADLGVTIDLERLSSDELADAARNVNLNLLVGNPPDATPPTAEDLQRDVDKQLLGGLTVEQLLPGTLQSITTATGDNGEVFVTVVLNTGATETFVVTTDESGVETWSTTDGTVVATFNRGSGTLEDDRALVRTLVVQVNMDNPNAAATPNPPGSATTPSSSNSDSPGDTGLPAGSTGALAAAVAYEEIYFTFYLQALLEGMSPEEAAAWAKLMADEATGQGDGNEDDIDN